MRHFKSILLLAILSLFSSGCALYHHYGPYYGKVVDADTQKPLEGAVVLAKYITWLWAGPGGEVSYFLDTQEVVTDNKGEFRIPSLDAFAFRPLSTFEPQAQITIFKPRYECSDSPIPEDRYETRVLKELKTRNERLANLRHCYPLSVPDNKMKKYIVLENAEDIDLGLEPRPMRKE
jgi:hypothetical protein